MAFYKGTVQIAGGGQTDISDCAFKSKDNNFTAKNTFASLAAASGMPDGSALDGMSLVMTGTDGSRNVSFEQLKAAVQTKGSDGNMFIDLLDGNAPIKFETQAQIKQCPCNCYMALFNGSGSFPSISGTGKSDDWVTIALSTSGYYIKRGTFVKGNANVILLPCEKYVQNNWYFDADSEITRWLPNTAGRYKVEMTGGKGGDASVSGLSKTGGNGRKLIFEVDVQTPDIFTLSVGQSQAAVAGDPPQYQWITNTGLNGGDTTFLNISAPGGTGATVTAFRGDYGWIINQSGTDGTTPEPPTEDEVRNGLPEGVTYVEGSYDGSEASDHGYISIFRIEENA